MKRKIFETEVGQSLEIDTDYSYGSAEAFCIVELRNFLEKAEDDGATHVKISGTVDDGCVDDVDIQPYLVEKETDDAYAKRLAEEESKKEAAKNVERAKEKALYEKLKLKYGD